MYLHWKSRWDKSQVFSSTTLVIPVKNGVNIEMVKLRPGTFAMGATPEMLEPYDNERPAHQVTLTKLLYRKV